MSAPLNRLTENMPFSDFTLNDDINCQELCVYRQLGVGVVVGMTLSAGAGLTLNVAAGTVQNPRTVSYPGGTTAVPNNAINYIMCDWTTFYNPSLGASDYTFSFSFQSSPTPPGGQVCLGRVSAASGSITNVSTLGLFVLPHVLGSQFIVGQNRLVVDDSTGLSSAQNMQSFGSNKNVLQSGDNAIINAGYQTLLFGSFTVPSGATFTCSGQLRVIS